MPPGVDAHGNAADSAAMATSAALDAGASADRAAASATQAAGAISRMSPEGSAWNVASLTEALANTRVHKPPDCLKLPTFKGTYAESPFVPSFLRRATAYMSYHNLIESQTQLAALYSCFPMGTASALWFEKAVPAMSNFEDFRVQFAERFHLNVADRTKYLSKLNKFAQRPQDSVISYYSSLTELYDNLGQVGLTFHPDEIKMKFIDNLRPELCATVMTQESISPLALEKALTIAMNHERLLPKRAAPTTNGNARPALNAAGTGNGGNQNAGGKKKAFACNFCKQPGHIFADCPKVAAKKAAGTWEDRARPQ